MTPWLSVARRVQSVMRLPVTTHGRCVQMHEDRVRLQVDFVRVKGAGRQVGKQVLDDFRLHLRLRRGLLAPVVDLQLATGQLVL